MALKSIVFKAGKKIPCTLFTIIGQSQTGTWSGVKCRCECGREVELTYHQAYYKKYSCGCTSRRGPKVNFAGRVIEGNCRKLTMIGEDQSTGMWTVYCSFCDGTHEYTDLGYGILRAIQKRANERCPEDRNFVDVDHIENLYMYYRGRMPDETRSGSKSRIADWLEQFYEPRHVRKHNGEIIGFLGAPDKPVPPKREVRVREVSAVTEDPDGFGYVV